MKSTSYYIKSSLLATALFIESFILTRVIIEFIESQKLLAPTLEFMGLVILLFWALTTTHALLAGAWKVWEQYVLGPLPIALGLFVATYTINSTYALVLMLIVLGLLTYELMLASQLKSQLLEFNARMVLKHVSKGLILAFSISSAVLVVIHAGKQPEINLGNMVGEFVDEHISPQIGSQINSQIGGQLEEDITPEQMERLKAFGLDPSMLSNPTVIEGNPSDALKALQGGGLGSISLKETVSQKVNDLVEPYKKFLNPIMAVLIFGQIQFLGILAYLVYNLFIGGIFKIAKNTGFFKIEKVPAEKETLHF